MLPKREVRYIADLGGNCCRRSINHQLIVCDDDTLARKANDSHQPDLIRKHRRFERDHVPTFRDCDRIGRVIDFDRLALLDGRCHRRRNMSGIATARPQQTEQSAKNPDSCRKCHAALMSQSRWQCSTRSSVGKRALIVIGLRLFILVLRWHGTRRWCAKLWADVGVETFG